MIKIAIASGKGGTGKTFISTHLFHVMYEAGVSVAMVDCDAEVPNDILFMSAEVLHCWPVEVFCPTIDLDKCTLCGSCAEACHFHAITCISSARYVKVMPDLCHACTACYAVCRFGAIIPGRKTIGEVTAYGNNDAYLYEARLKEGEHSPVPIIRAAIQQAEKANTDYLILDAPPGCACPFVNTVKDADIVILVTEPTPFGLSDLKHTVEVLRHLKKPFAVLINRSDLGDSRMKRFLEEEKVHLLAEVPYSEKIAKAYSKGELSIGAEPQLLNLFTGIMNNILDYENSRY